ncbi:MAG: cytochrome c [Verrucomicrobiae bacterium]|nr:cytochrome c [Verrucomicrobiae bacterium]
MKSLTLLLGGALAVAESAVSSDWAAFVEPEFPFFGSVLDARRLGSGWPRDNLTSSGIILNLGRGYWACFDLDLLRVALVWRGEGVSPASMAQGSYHDPGHKAPEGIDSLPEPTGTPWLATRIRPGWHTGHGADWRDPRDPGPDAREVGRGPLPPDLGEFRALRWVGDGVVLEYEVAGVPVVEWVRAVGHAVHREFQVAWVPQPLNVAIGRLAPGLEIKAWAKGGDGRVILDQDGAYEGEWVLKVAEGPLPLRFRVTVAPTGIPEGEDVDWNTPPSDPPARHWQGEVRTRRIATTRADALEVDSVGLPLDNPWRRNVRLADLGFFRDGMAAAVTFDGDVWRVTGLEGGLDSVRWHRFASGLHEPLGLCVRDDVVFVHDRNGIWRLLDTDGNGEADRHERLPTDLAQTAETREFALGLRVLPDGAFVLAKGGQRGATLGRHSGMVLRVPAEGGPATVLAHGLRQPFLGVHPETGTITVSDQQGHYVPTTALHQIAGGPSRYHGFLPLILPRNAHPEPIADPLTWIPHAINASASGQVWASDTRMGPLHGALIHLGYFRPELFAVRPFARAAVPGAAVMSLTRDLSFPPLAGTVNPKDGEVYVIGFQIWGTVAPAVSGLARLRPGGGPSLLPREVTPFQDGILLCFDVPLHDGTVSNPANYSVERWNYRRSDAYGSAHYRADGSRGQDTLPVRGVALADHGRSVFVAVEGMAPAMQMRIGWALETPDGTSVRNNAYFSLSMLSPFVPEAEGFGRLNFEEWVPSARSVPVGSQVSVEEGQRLADLMGCVACHSVDGSTLGRVGPTWKGLFRSERMLTDGRVVVADEAYLRRAIREPDAEVVRGFEGTDTGMPSYEGVLTDTQIEALVKYLTTLGD